MNTTGLYVPNHIRTYSGKQVNIFKPHPDMFCVVDIAHSLANICRFNGHLKKFYSVGEHSLNVSLRCSDANKLQGQFHDGSEPYLCDLPSPIKANFKEYKEIEDNLMYVIAKKFGFKWPMSPEVAQLDKHMLELEYNCLMLGQGNMPHFHNGTGDIKTDFLNYYTFLTGDTSWKQNL